MFTLLFGLALVILALAIGGMVYPARVPIQVTVLFIAIYLALEHIPLGR